MLPKAPLVAVALALSGLTLTACVDDGHHRPGLIVVDRDRHRERDYRLADRPHAPRYERRDYRDRRDVSRFRDHCLRFPRDRACYR